jgi:hypothetical protein
MFVQKASQFIVRESPDVAVIILDDLLEYGMTT